MKEELSRLQEDLENMTEEVLQSLDSMELKEQIKFQESTAIVASRNVDFCVKVDDDIHKDATLEVQSKELKKKGDNDPRIYNARSHCCWCGRRTHCSCAVPLCTGQSI